MKISFHGAARTVTGSKHLVRLSGGRNILLDCGMFQGMGNETDELNENFGFEAGEISCLLLSHAHIDHSGLIPKLVKEGFSGKIYCTEATRDLTEILLYDSAEIQGYETDFINRRREKRKLPPYQPLYTSEDVEETMKLFETVSYGEWFQPAEDVSVLLTNAGHLIGSSSITIRAIEEGKETSLFYSGDVGRYLSVLLRSPEEFPQADHIILESTYGNKHHDISFNTIEELKQWIEKICIKKEGQLIIPAFSVGRTQEILYALNQLSLEKRLPETYYFVDSPLSSKATSVIKKHKEQFSERLQQVLEVDDDPFDFPGLRYIDNVEESKKLTAASQACVIISASGTADAGRVRHHINSCIGKSNNAILMVGYCGSGSLGGQLLKGAKDVEIFDDPLKVNAKVGQLQGMSAHADSDDLLRFLACQDPEKVKNLFLVHGEYEVQQAFIPRLNLKGFKNIEMPSLHQEFDLSEEKIIEERA
jgi:metallo-beta-lactamase family protein